MNTPEEWFEVVDEHGQVLRLATRRECHTNRALRHRVAHVLVWDTQHRLYLQKRSFQKDIQPGKWDTSVGGHLHPGEDPAIGARRELGEELGLVTSDPLVWLYQYEMQSPVETELVDTFSLAWSGEVFPNPDEIAEGRWWQLEEIRRHLGCDLFTPNFEEEFQRWQGKNAGK